MRIYSSLRITVTPHIGSLYYAVQKFLRLFYVKVILFLWIPKPPSKFHMIFLVQPGSLLWTMEFLGNFSYFCLILENYLLLASHSNLRLFHLLSGLFLCQALLWHFVALFFSFISVCLLAYLSLLSYHSLVPTWSMAFLPEHSNLHGVDFSLSTAS